MPFSQKYVMKHHLSPTENSKFWVDERTVENYHSDRKRKDYLLLYSHSERVFEENVFVCLENWRAQTPDEIIIKLLWPFSKKAVSC